MTDILIAPLRANTALLAKQAATLNHLSGGRLVLGLAVGGRPDDYEASGSTSTRADASSIASSRSWRATGAARTAWAAPDGRGRACSSAAAPTPRSGAPPATATAGRWAAARPRRSPRRSRKLRDAWQAEGRDGRAAHGGAVLLRAGRRRRGAGRAPTLGDYYGFLGEYAEQIIAGAAKDEGAIRARIAAFDEAGCDEVICFPTSPDPGQVDLLARAVLTQPTSSAGTG